MKSLCLILLLVLIPLSSRALDLTGLDNGKSVSVSLTEKLSVTLPGNPTTGYRWDLAEISSGVLNTNSESAFAADSTMLGAGGKFTFLFTAVQPGTTGIKLIYHRPWEKNVQPLRTFDLTVSVIAAEQLKTAIYQSADGKVLEATFDLKLNQVQIVLPDGRKVRLPVAVSGSGARYSDGTDTFWEHQGVGSFFKGESLLFKGALLRTINK